MELCIFIFLFSVISSSDSVLLPSRFPKPITLWFSAIPALNFTFFYNKTIIPSCFIVIFSIGPSTFRLNRQNSSKPSSLFIYHHHRVFQQFLPSSHWFCSMRNITFICVNVEPWAQSKTWKAITKPYRHVSLFLKGLLGYRRGHGPLPYFTPRAIFYIICVHLPPQGSRMRTGNILVIYCTF
jgi:hypothetical protein